MNRTRCTDCTERTQYTEYTVPSVPTPYRVVRGTVSTVTYSNIGKRPVFPAAHLRATLEKYARRLLPVLCALLVSSESGHKFGTVKSATFDS
jgi:hypothetical protein